PVTGARRRGLLAVEEVPLLLEAADVPLHRVAGVQLAHLRQEQVLERRFRGGHRPDAQAHHGPLTPRTRGEQGQRHGGEKDADHCGTLPAETGETTFSPWLVPFVTSRW